MSKDKGKGKGLSKEDMKTKVSAGTLSASEVETILKDTTQKTTFKTALSEISSEVELTEYMLHVLFGSEISKFTSQAALEDAMGLVNTELKKRTGR
jgi:hypothetical protein